MISAIVLTSNEEEVLEDALKSLKGFADEIIIVDSKSTDKTISIAKKFGAKIIEHTLSDFSEQRNIGMARAQGDFVFYLDSDERLTPEFIKEAKEQIALFNPMSTTAGFFVKRKTYYLGKDWGYQDRVQRLFYKKKFKEWYGVVHETPQADGTFETLNHPIIHFTHRNLEQMLTKTNKWSDYEAELRLHANHPHMSWWRFPRVMVSEFFRSYFREDGWKNGTEGIIESIYQSFSMFITYAKLWELQNKK